MERWGLFDCRCIIELLTVRLFYLFFSLLSSSASLSQLSQVQWHFWEKSAEI